MDDKKTIYTFPIHFGENCYIGDEVFRRQYTDRSAAAATEVAVTQCTDRRCSYWPPFNSTPADEPAGNGDENDANIELCTIVGPTKCELGGGHSVGPAISELIVGNPVEPAKSELGGGNPVGPADAMGPLNIMAAIIPFESTFSTAAADADQLSLKSSSGSSFEIQFDDDDDENGESDK